MARRLALFAALAGMLALAVLVSRPPAPAGPDAPPTAFSAARAMADIREIGRVAHETGSTEDARVRAYLAQRLRGLGLETHETAAALSPRGAARLARWTGRTGAPAPLAIDVVGRARGRDPSQPAVLLMAHHDTVPGSPGAADDSAGVAVILETLRALRAGPPPIRDLIVAFTDAEELDSAGARGFFAADPLAARVEAVINLDARGGGGRAMMFETGEANGPMMRLFAHAVRGPTATSAAVFVYRLLPNDTDFTVAKARGLSGFNFAFLGRPALYHAPQALPETVDLGSVQQMGGETLDLARALVTAPALPGHGPNLVFADLFGMGLALFPPAAGWAVIGAAFALFLAAGWRAARAGRLSAAGLAVGVGEALGAGLVAVGLLELANRLSGAGPHANYFGRLALLPQLELQALAIGLSVLCLTAGRDAGDRRWDRWLGALAVILAMAAGLQAWAPEAAPVLAWPCLAGTAAAAAAAWLESSRTRAASLVVIALAAIVAGGWTLALAHLVFLGDGADSPGAMAAFLLVVLALVRPLLAGTVSTRLAVTLAAILLAGGFALAASARLAPPAATIPIYARSPS